MHVDDPASGLWHAGYEAIDVRDDLPTYVTGTFRDRDFCSKSVLFVRRFDARAQGGRFVAKYACLASHTTTPIAAVMRGVGRHIVVY